MASISSLGIGSGVLTSDLIDKLTAAERDPIDKRLTAQTDKVNAQISDFGKIQSAVTDFRLAARSLGNAAALSAKTATSSNSAVSVTATSSAAAAQYSINVTSIAHAQSLASGVLADQDQTGLGTGSLTIKTGTATKTITIDSTNNTLQGLAQEINKASLGISASVINTGSGYQLALTSQNTGTANAIDISVADSDGNNTDSSGLSQLSFTAGAQNLSEKIAATDAVFSINGIDVTRSTNSFSDVISGLTINLTGTTSSAATVAVSQDTSGVTQRVQDLVDKYNAIQTLIKDDTKYDPSGAASGSLVGNNALRSISSQFRSIFASVVPGLETASVRSLAEVGIATDTNTGQLTFDSTKFQSQLAAHEDDVVALFSKQGRTTDSQVSYASASPNTKVGTYAINVTQLATQGNLTGSVALGGSTVIDANNDTFTIKVDGTTSNAITLTDNATGYTATDLVTEIQKQIDADTNLRDKGIAVKVSLDGSNQLVFTSKSYGSKSTVEFTQVGSNSLASLGIDAVAGTAGVDVAGTINGVAAVGSGQSLTGATGDASEGIKVNITGGVTGDRGSVSYISGVGNQFVDLINSFLDQNGTITATNDGFQKQLDSIAKQRQQLDDRISALTARLQTQFTAADAIVSQLKTTQSFLTAQLGALTGSSSSSSK